MSESSQPEAAVQMTKNDVTDSLNIPLNFPEMVSQAARSMNEAYDAGVTRQTIRVMLPRNPSSGDLGLYFESDAKLDTQNLILVPPDETWQGGIMQLYRYVYLLTIPPTRDSESDIIGSCFFGLGTIILS